MFSAALLVAMSVAPAQIGPPIIPPIGPLAVLPRFPDETDVLRGADTKPNLFLVLDRSSSMGWDPQNTICSYYTSSQGVGGPTNSHHRMHMLRAALTGCTSANDGVIDKWANRVNFAVQIFHSSSSRLLDFGNTPAALETAILGLNPGGGTAFARGYADASNHMRNHFVYDAANPFAATNNTRQCRQNYIVMMSDGVGNGANGSLNYGPAAATQAISDAGNSFTAIANPCSRAGTPFGDCGAERLFDDGTGTPQDSMPNVSGTQAIRTYTIGFNAPVAAKNLMIEMGNEGDGGFTDAQNYAQLDAAFTNIITSIVARSGVAFEQATVQNDGLFSGNTAYTTSFRPVDRGPWFGNAKKFCLLPADVATDTGTCLFTYDPAGILISNANPADQFNAGVGTETLLSGSGQSIWNMHGITAATDPIPSPGTARSRRNLYTYVPGTAAYVPLNGAASFANTDSWTSNNCEHFKLLNKLHGFTDQVTDCAGGNYDPVAFDEWPLGDTIHGGTALLRYDANCDLPGRCLLTTVSNDGILHQFDTADGLETQGLVPGHLWRPGGPALHQMKDLMNQPTLTEGRRFLYDGDMVLYHTDDDGDGVIDNGETAKLITGLGRAGYAYIMWDVSSPATVSINSTTRLAITDTAAPNPPLELMADNGSSFKNLKETWAAPKIARYRDYASATSPRPAYDVGVFPSGHSRDRDLPLDTGLVGLSAPPPPPSGDTQAAPQNQACAAFGVPQALCDLALPPAFVNPIPLACVASPANCFQPRPPNPSVNLGDISTFMPATSCTPCNATPAGPTSTDLLAAATSCGATPASPPCYDWPGWSMVLAAGGIAFNGSGIDAIFGPFSFNDGTYEGVSYRMRFSRMDLQPGDRIEILDGSQNLVGSVTGNTLTGPWVNDTSFFIRYVTDGVDVAPGGLGFGIDSVDYVRAPVTGAVAAAGQEVPTIWFVDLARWNGPAPKGFVDTPAPGEQDQAVLVRFASDCEGIDTTKCVDATTPPSAGGSNADLRFMNCPISMRPEIYDEGGYIRAWYVGDECGQIFRGRVDPASGRWDVRRLLTLNQVDGAGYVQAGALSKDYRKLFRQLELVLSNCTGSRAIGVYFGSGNLQRPAEFDNLQGTVADLAGSISTNDDRNVIGVVWDRTTPPPAGGHKLTGMDNITLSPQTTPTSGSGSVGWFIELSRREKMLRDPLVFDGVASFKTYVPTTQAVECVSAEGASFVYSLNNCDGYPANDGGDGYHRTDRSKYNPSSSIGGELLLVAPKDKPPVKLDPDQGGGQIGSARSNFAWKIFLWRTKIVAPN